MSIDVEDLYRRYGPLVLRRCRQLLRREEDAVEVMHDVFVEVVRQRNHLEVRNPSSLMYTIATNRCLNRIRSRKRRPEDASSDIVERVARAPSSDALSAARLMLERIFSRQPDSTRAMAVMHLLDGMTLQEVADHFDMSVSGVRKRLRTLKAHVAELEAV